MITGNIRANPRFAEFRGLLAAKPELFLPWSGTLFRFQTVEFPTPEDVLSGLGAKQRGGRWNPPGVTALYGSTTDATALEESKANDRYAGMVNRSPPSRWKRDWRACWILRPHTCAANWA